MDVELTDTRARNRVKGAMFEVIVKVLLFKSGYKQLPSDPKYVKGDKLRGRGAWHQIDAFGQFSYGIPFLFPIRLICEAKYYGTIKVGLPQVRNFLGAYKDIQEVYHIENYGQSSQVLTKRYTDAAAVFSASGFTTLAQGYAYAQGIRLISYESNPLFLRIINLMEICIDNIYLENASRNINDFKSWFVRLLEPLYPISQYNGTYYSGDQLRPLNNLKEALSNIKTSYLASIRGILPIHILSEMNIPWNIFTQTDQVLCEFYYSIERPNLFRLKVRDNNFGFYFSVPKEIVEKYRRRFDEESVTDVDSSLRERARMRSVKRELFTSIDVPVVHEGMRRIISFKIDESWLNEL